MPAGRKHLFNLLAKFCIREPATHSGNKIMNDMMSQAMQYKTQNPQNQPPIVRAMLEVRIKVLSTIE